jgi:hypothetical protein
MTRTAPFLAVLAIATGLAPIAAQDAPLPDRESFLAEARKRLASNDLLQSRYTFRERVSEMRFNPFGAIGTGPISVYEVYPVVPGQLTYRRLVERDATPTPPSELLQADRQFLARYHQWQRELAREGQDERQARRKREAAEREKDRARAAEAVGLFQFTLERRDELEGHPVIVVRFTPKPNVRPQSREGRVAASFSGTAWIHEHEHEVMRVEAEAGDDTVFGYGVIARLHKGAKAQFIRRKVGDAWLPVETRVTGTGRAMLFRKVNINYLREYSHYRPFDLAAFMQRFGAATGNN